jgi:N utilization substance protein B
MSARTKARKRALDLLYGADVRSGRISDAIATESIRAEAEPSRAASWEYARQIAAGVDEHQAEIDELIETYAQGWTIGRMPALDRAIVRIGIWELAFNAEIPDGVAISEAVDAARTYSTEDSAGFVNGLLGRIAQATAFRGPPADPGL